MWNTKSHGVCAYSPISLVFGAADTVKSIELTDVLGTLQEVDMLVPNWTNVVNATLTVERVNGCIAFTGTPRAKNASYVELPNRCIGKGDILKITLSGAPGAGGGTLILYPYLN